ncbi:MAG: hypothetical protein IPI46_12720 [Bacteroidetes bacterium]|nr:hypothetical protein [Bacteroidota bacterium]
MKISYKVWLISIIAITCIFIIHFLIPTMVNGFQRDIHHIRQWQSIWNDDYGVSLCLDRMQLCEFYRRPLMYRTQMFLFTQGIPYQFSFVAISFVGLFITGIMLTKIASLMGIVEKFLPIVIIAFYAHFTIVFAFFDSMSTYDEPLMYVFLSTAIYSILKQKLWLAFPFFLLACIARETSFMLLPIVFITPGKNSLHKKIGFAALLLTAYCLYFYYYVPPNLRFASASFLVHDRIYAWQHNFRNIYESIQSILCMILATALPFYMLYNCLQKPSITFFQKRWIQYTLALIVINNVIVLAFGLAAEARLFALPLLLAFPMLPLYVQLNSFHIPWKNKRFLISLFVVIIMSTLFVIFGYRCYESNIHAVFLFKTYTVLYFICFWITIFRPVLHISPRWG